MTNKGFLALAIATVIAVIAALSLRQPESDSSVAGGHFFGGLLENVNQVTKVIVKSESDKVTLVRADAVWKVAEKDNYPAAIDKTRGVILGLARLKKIEPKTRNPELYDKLGVQGANEGSTLIQLVDGQGKDLAVALLGKRKNVSGKPGVSQMYIRRPDEAQAWLVEGSVPSSTAATEWLRQDLVKIAAARVRGVRVTHADGEVVTIEKAEPGKQDYVLSGLEEGETVETQHDVNRIADSFRGLRLADVLSTSEVTGSRQDGAIKAELTTFDGLRIDLTATRDGDKVYARLDAVFDKDLVQSAQPGTDDSEKNDDKVSTEQSDKTVSALQSPEQTKTEAERLHTQWQGWVHVIPTYQFDNLAVKKTDLLKKKKNNSVKEPGVSLPGRTNDANERNKEDG